MCHDKSWFVAQDNKAKIDKPEMKDKRSDTVDALLRDSKEQAQKAAGHTPEGAGARQVTTLTR